MTKKVVLFRGPVLTMSGYGMHARDVARWLLKRDDIDARFSVTDWGHTPWLIDSNACNGLVGEVMRRTVQPGHKADASIQLQLPNEWDPALAKTNVGITAGVETDRCNPTWVDACNRMSALVVPSQHTLNTFVTSGNLTCPRHVVPESYNDAIRDLSLPALPDLAAPFNFLVFGQLTGNNPENDRKNTFYAIKWLCEAFKDDKDVGIVVKTNAGKNSRADRAVTKDLIKSVVEESRKGSPFPRVTLLHGSMTDHEVAALYRHPQVKALVALTRGEGYGLPILEAAASDLPVIATGWSGHLDFLKRGKFISVYYTLSEVHKSRIDGNIFVKGARWAQPSEDDFKKRALKLRSSYATPKSWAVELGAELRRSYGFEQVAALYDEVLGAYV